MREEEADRFFGREAEIEELVEKFRKHRVVAIVADSGTGKSSLAEAGFVPAFRGGALADSCARASRTTASGTSSRCGRAPIRKKACGPASPRRRKSSAGRRTSARACANASRSPIRARPLSRCNATCRREKTATLLIVDQFEELFTATPDALVAPFVKLLLDLADGDKDFRILLTVRADYFNLLSDIKDAAGEAVKAPTARPCSSASTPRAATRSCG